jgi:hypothetical protein
MVSCTICEMSMPEPTATEPDLWRFDCARCGTFDLTGTARQVATNRLASNRRLRMVTSHNIRKMQRQGAPPKISDDVLERIWSEGRLPSPAQQADTLIEIIGNRDVPPGEYCAFLPPFLAGSIGTADDGRAASTQGLNFVLRHLSNDGLLDSSPGDRPGSLGLRLTFRGWQHFENLKRSTSVSRIAFMAMKYGRPVTDRLFREYLKPATEETGFQLRRLDEVPRAGLIDQHMEVDIRRAKFLVADLTFGNRGAYWEAGFAAGLGKPVFYLCEAGKFRRVGTHFDTNHHYTIPWNESDLSAAADKLKTAIRATLPADAKQADN